MFGELLSLSAAGGGSGGVAGMFARPRVDFLERVLIQRGDTQ